MKKFLTSPVRLWICVVSIFVMLIGIGTWGFAKGYWDWDKKQIFQLNAYRIRPPETPGNNYNLEIGTTGRTTVLYGTITNSATAVNGGTYASPTITSPTITSPTITSPTITSPTISGTITATGLVTTANIADETREWTSLDLVSAYVDGSGPITTATAPALEATAHDNIPAIRYDGSSETTGVSWTKRVPTNYKTGGQGGLLVYALVSSGTRTTNRDFSDIGIDWLVWLNRDDRAFASSEYAQSTVMCSGTTIDESNEVLTLYASSALVNAIQAGDWLTFEFFNASTSSLTGYEDDLEIKGLDIHAVFKR